MTRLFIVPCEAAGRSKTSPKPSNAASTIRWDVSTFPPATARGIRASTTLPLRVRTSTSSAQPAAPMGEGSSRLRATKRQADSVTALGQLRLPSTSSAEAERSKTKLSFLTSMSTRIGTGTVEMRHLPENLLRGMSPLAGRPEKRRLSGYCRHGPHAWPSPDILHPAAHRWPPTDQHPGLQLRSARGDPLDVPPDAGNSPG